MALGLMKKPTAPASAWQQMQEFRTEARRTIFAGLAGRQADKLTQSEIDGLVKSVTRHIDEVVDRKIASDFRKIEARIETAIQRLKDGMGLSDQLKHEIRVETACQYLAAAYVLIDESSEKWGEMKRRGSATDEITHLHTGCFYHLSIMQKDIRSVRYDDPDAAALTKLAVDRARMIFVTMSMPVPTIDNYLTQDGSYASRHRPKPTDETAEKAARRDSRHFQEPAGSAARYISSLSYLSEHTRSVLSDLRPGILGIITGPRSGEERTRIVLEAYTAEKGLATHALDARLRFLRGRRDELAARIPGAVASVVGDDLPDRGTPEPAPEKPPA